MEKKFINLTFILLPVVVFISCSNSNSDSNQTGETELIHKLFTNENAVNNSIVDSSLLAPDFTYPSMDGDEFTLSEHRGKVIVLNLWATSCGPCIEEMPDFIALQNEFRDRNVEFVGLTVDESWDVVRPFVQEHGLNFRIILDNENSIFEKYPLQGLPDTYVINKQGEVAHVIISQTNKEYLRPLLTHLTEI